MGIRRVDRRPGAGLSNRSRTGADQKVNAPLARLRIVASMLARFPLEIHLWTIPLLFATGWVIGYVHFRESLRRKHPDLFEEWSKRTTKPEEEEE